MRAGARFWLVITIGGSAFACRANDATVDTAGRFGNSVPARTANGCGPGRQGCACDALAEEAACGTQVGQYGGYVTCGMGRSVCTGGHWGPCITGTLVAKSLAGMAIGPGGLHALSTTIHCPGDSGLCLDACDPNAYALVASGPGDVDAANGTISGDGGLTLAPGSLAVGCSGVGCQVALDCPSGSPTTLAGTVRDPAGANPVDGAYIYVPVDPTALPKFSSSASCDPCAGTGGVPAVASAKTGSDGTFLLTNVPSTDVAPGNQIPLVVQIGKWRREVMLASVPKCKATPVDPDSARLPRNKFDGFGNQADIPKMAIATGSADPFECMLLKMGVDPAEFQVPGTGTRRIDSYLGSSAIDFPAPTVAHPKSALVGSLSALMNYDVVFLPCGGVPEMAPNGPFPLDNLYADNIAAYANAGGRVLATHRSYIWLSTPSYVNGSPVANGTNPATGKPNPFFGVANWSLDSQQFNGVVNADIDTTLPGKFPYPKGQEFSNWMHNVGASPVPAQVSIEQPKYDVDSVNATATAWIHNHAPSGEPFLFSFDTPPGTGGGVRAGGGGATLAPTRGTHLARSRLPISTPRRSPSSTRTRMASAALTPTAGLPQRATWVSRARARPRAVRKTAIVEGADIRAQGRFKALASLRAARMQTAARAASARGANAAARTPRTRRSAVATSAAAENAALRRAHACGMRIAGVSNSVQEGRSEGARSRARATPTAPTATCASPACAGRGAAMTRRARADNAAETDHRSAPRLRTPFHWRVVRVS